MNYSDVDLVRFVAVAAVVISLALIFACAPIPRNDQAVIRAWQQSNQYMGDTCR